MSRLRHRLHAGLLLGAFLLSGCTAAQRAALDHGVEAARQAKDSEAESLKAAVCAMSIGAYHRVNNDAEKRALDVLCGGVLERDPEATAGITADDVEAIRELERLFGGP